jgi:multimeric flavodoxin WrbA
VPRDNSAISFALPGNGHCYFHGAMKAVLLDGAPAGHGPLEALHALVCDLLATKGYSVDRFVLRDRTLSPCRGDFDCWVRTPGRCKIHDGQDAMAAAIHDAELLVLLGPVTFGGHCAEVKKALDRLICLILPMFHKRAGLTHHAPRYRAYPRMVGVGWLPAHDPEPERIFRALVESNALNMGSPGWGAVVVAGEPSAGDQVAAALAARAEPGNFSGDRRHTCDELREVARADAAAGFAARPRTAILVGSARPTGTSTSESLGRFLAARLEAAGAPVTLVPATRFLHEGPATDACAAELASADLLVLATPLYVDSLPYLATRALERVARARAAGAARARFAAVVNCGFPEAEHNRVALGIARAFARAAGYGWAGGLALGGGEAIHGRPLESLGAMTRNVRGALAAAAGALAAGGAVPDAAVHQMSRRLLPSPVYRLIGDWGWRRQARAHGLTPADLHATPLDDRAG